MRGEMCGLLVGASMVLYASGNYQVRYTGTVVTFSSPSFPELVVPLPSQKPTTTEDTSQPEGPLGLTEEEEKELAELMGDDV